MPYVVTSECNQCGACIAGCESDAITEGETQSIIDPNKCIECGTCEANCPFNAIIFVQDDENAGQALQAVGAKND
ncbi:MAG: 4Fe-4S binding protein [Chloroflexota bacterium]